MKQIDMYWIDMHCDTLSELMKVKNGNLQENTLCVDIKRLKQIKTAAQFFACYVNAAEYPENGAVYPGNGAAYPGERRAYNWNSAYRAVQEMLEYAHQQASSPRSFPGYFHREPFET